MSPATTRIQSYFSSWPILCDRVKGRRERGRREADGHTDIDRPAVRQRHREI